MCSFKKASLKKDFDLFNNINTIPLTARRSCILSHCILCTSIEPGSERDTGERREGEREDDKNNKSKCLSTDLVFSTVT